MTTITKRAFAFGGLALAAVGAFAAGPARAQETVTLKYATFTPEMSITTQEIVIPFLERVKAESEGTLDFEVFSGGTLGRNPAQQLKLVQDGVADMAFVVPSYLPGAFDGYNVSQLPLGATTATQGSLGLWRAYETGKLATPRGVRVLGLFTNGPNMIHTSEERTELDGVEGMKLRVAGDVQTEIARALGANPIGQIPVSQVAETMSRGVIDGALVDWTAMRTFRVLEVADHHLQIPLGMVANMIPINAEVYESLPEPAKAAIDKHSGAWFAELAGNAFDAATEEVLEAARADEGRVIVDPDPAAAKAVDARMEEVVSGWVGKDADREALVAAFQAGVEDARSAE